MQYIISWEHTDGDKGKSRYKKEKSAQNQIAVLFNMNSVKSISIEKKRES